MLLHVPEVLTPKSLRAAARSSMAAEWADGRVTAGSQSGAGEEQSAAAGGQRRVARGARRSCSTRSAKSALFFTAALPKRIFPPLFNRYAGAYERVRQSRRQCGAHCTRATGAARAHRPLGDAVSVGAGRLRRRRARDRRHVRHAVGQAARRATWCCIPRPACTASSRSRAARASHRSSGSRAWCATTAQRTAAVRSRHGDTRACAAADGDTPRGRAPDRLLSQPAADVGAAVATRRRRTGAKRSAHIDKDSDGRARRVRATCLPQQPPVPQ